MMMVAVKNICVGEDIAFCQCWLGKYYLWFVYNSLGYEVAVKLLNIYLGISSYYKIIE